MSEIDENQYEPEIEYIEEEDQGYSIPKILVAILIIVLIGIIIFIFGQQKKLGNVIDLLQGEKQKADTELNSMIEKYNSAINNNDSLTEERQRLIHYRDSLLKIKNSRKKRK